MGGSRTDDKIRALSSMGLFEGCTKRELQQAAKLCTFLSLEAGSVLTAEGTRGLECLVIAEGKAQVTISGKPIGTVGAGECVGEMALLDPAPRTATVTALTPMGVYVLSTKEFQALLNVNPAIGCKIAATLARRLRMLEVNHLH